MVKVLVLTEKRVDKKESETMGKSRVIYIALLHSRSGHPKFFICGDNSDDVFNRARARLQGKESIACECFVAYDFDNKLTTYHSDIRDSLNQVV
ncbi:hypothetical protein ES703_84344 [subsurface metagenome]